MLRRLRLLLRLLRVLALRIFVVRLISPGDVFSPNYLQYVSLCRVQGELLSTDRLYRVCFIFDYMCWLKLRRLMLICCLRYLVV